MAYDSIYTGQQIDHKVDTKTAVTADPIAMMTGFTTGTIGSYQPSSSNSKSYAYIYTPNSINTTATDGSMLTILNDTIEYPSITFLNNTSSSANSFSYRTIQHPIYMTGLTSTIQPTLYLSGGSDNWALPNSTTKNHSIKATFDSWLIQFKAAHLNSATATALYSFYQAANSTTCSTFLTKNCGGIGAGNSASDFTYNWYSASATGTIKSTRRLGTIYLMKKSNTNLILDCYQQIAQGSLWINEKFVAAANTSNTIGTYNTIQGLGNQLIKLQVIASTNATARYGFRCRGRSYGTYAIAEIRDLCDFIDFNGSTFDPIYHGHRNQYNNTNPGYYQEFPEAVSHFSWCACPSENLEISDFSANYAYFHYEELNKAVKGVVAGGVYFGEYHPDQTVIIGQGGGDVTTPLERGLPLDIRERLKRSHAYMVGVGNNLANVYVNVPADGVPIYPAHLVYRFYKLS